MLKLKEGWEVREEYDTEKRWVIPTGADFEHAYAVIDFNAEVHAYPFGADEAVFVGTIDAAHEHCLAVGSQSPWYDARPDGRVTELDAYQKAALRTAGDPGRDGWLFEKLFGLSEECGETLGLIKKAEFHGRELDRDALRKELGDVLWYLSTIAHFYNFRMSDIATANVEKLRKRYPEGFSVEASLNRKD